MSSENIEKSPAACGVRRTAEEIQNWLKNRIAGELGIRPESVSAEDPILSSGIDSLQVVSVVAQLEDWLGIRFSTNPLDESASIRDLSQRLATTQRLPVAVELRNRDADGGLEKVGNHDEARKTVSPATERNSAAEHPEVSTP